MFLLLYYNLQIQYIQSATAWQENPTCPHSKTLANIACEQLQSLAIYGTIAPEKEDAHEFTIISHSEKL